MIRSMRGVYNKHEAGHKGNRRTKHAFMLRCQRPDAYFEFQLSTSTSDHVLTVWFIVGTNKGRKKTLQNLGTHLRSMENSSVCKHVRPSFRDQAAESGCARSDALLRILVPRQRMHDHKQLVLLVRRQQYSTRLRADSK